MRPEKLRDLRWEEKRWWRRRLKPPATTAILGEKWWRRGPEEKRRRLDWKGNEAETRRREMKELAVERSFWSRGGGWGRRGDRRLKLSVAVNGAGGARQLSNGASRFEAQRRRMVETGDDGEAESFAVVVEKIGASWLAAKEADGDARLEQNGEEWRLERWLSNA